MTEPRFGSGGTSSREIKQADVDGWALQVFSGVKTRATATGVSLSGLHGSQMPADEPLRMQEYSLAR